MKKLMKGMIPREPFVTLVKGQLEKNGLNFTDLARILELDQRRFRRLEMQGSITFDLADRILCKLNLVHLWWGPLNDIYLACDLSGKKKISLGNKIRCSNVTCSETFVPKVHNHKFCCPTCKNTESLRRTGKLTGKRIGKGRKLLEFECGNGHSRTPENTYVYKSKRYCRECKRAANQLYYERNRESENARRAKRQRDKRAAAKAT